MIDNVILTETNMIKNKKLLQISLFALLFIGIIGNGGNSFALEFGLSQNEKAIFSFYKLTKKTPDFQALVEAMPWYKNEEDKSKKRHTYEQESTRLQLEFSNFSPRKNYLKINTDIYMQMRMSDGQPAFYFKFVNSGSEETPYFPYPFADDWIALIIKGLSRFVSIGLDEDQYTRARSFFQMNETYKGKINLELRPISAEGHSPVEVGGEKQWLMLADIGLLEFIYRDPATGKKESILGEYKASWYHNNGNSP